MALVVTDQGELQLLDKMINAALQTDESYILKLYQNNVTPTSSSDQTSFVEANFTNYVARTLTRAGWANAVTVGGTASSSYGILQSWTCGTTGNTIYGYWIEGSNSGVVLWAERFAAEKILSNTVVLELIPQFTLSSAN